MIKKKYALISVYNKNKINKICNFFKKNNINIISTGSTAAHINKLGYRCFKVSNVFKFKEILDGRVKTIHPLLHASILFDRDNKKHIKKIDNLKLPTIDYIIVNLYPFKKTVKTTKETKKIIEMIDIGGVALMRSAAKNYNFITTITNPNDYNSLLVNMKNNLGNTTLGFRKKMAAKAFKQTSEYDLNIYKWMINKKNISNLLRYGENPHQKSYYIKNSNKNTLFDCCINSDKKLSYNNLLDADSAINCVNEFANPTCVIVKHNNPCCVASDNNIYKSFVKSYKSDPVSSFGGVVALNRMIDEKLAKKISSNFFEILIAPKFSNSAKKILFKKKSLTLFEINKIKKNDMLDIKSINGGYLIQQKNKIVFNKKNMKCVTRKKASKKIIDDLIFGFKVSKHVKSNAIIFVKNKQTVAIGAGQMSRIDATKIAILKVSPKTKKNGYIAASDAFFPFVDNIQLLLKNNCKAIIQPFGSINDKKIIKFADSKNIPIYFSSFRFFKH